MTPGYIDVFLALSERQIVRAGALAPHRALAVSIVRLYIPALTAPEAAAFADWLIEPADRQ